MLNIPFPDLFFTSLLYSLATEVWEIILQVFLKSKINCAALPLSLYLALEKRKSKYHNVVFNLFINFTGFLKKCKLHIKTLNYKVPSWDLEESAVNTHCN